MGEEGLGKGQGGACFTGKPLRKKHFLSIGLVLPLGGNWEQEENVKMNSGYLFERLPGDFRVGRKHPIEGGWRGAGVRVEN